MKKQTTKIHNLTIRRSEWLREKKRKNKNYISGLLLLGQYGEKKRCCMGFDAHYICKIRDHRLIKKSLPSYVGLFHLQDIKWHIKGINFSLQDILADVNDRSFYPNSPFYWANEVSDREQEKIITRLYSLANYKVTFVD